MKIVLKLILVPVIVFQSFNVKADFNAAFEAYENKNYMVAFEEFSSLAEIGERRSQFNLGVMYYQGQFVEKDINKAFAWTKLATESDSVTEQEKMIHELILSKVTDMQIAEAIYKSLSSSYANQVLSERLYPVILQNEAGASFKAIPDKRKHKKYNMAKWKRNQFFALSGRDYQKLKNDRYQIHLKLDVDRLGNARNVRVVESVPNNYFNDWAMKMTSINHFKKKLDSNNHPIPQYDLSFTYEVGGSDNIVGIPSDMYKKTKKAAESGDMIAQLNIGSWHKRLSNLPEKINSTEWLFKAAQQGNINAQYEVGESLLYGQGCVSDRSKGVEWLTRAASSGQVDAMNLLAGLATNDSSIKAQKQALSYMSKLETLSASTAIRLSWLLATSPYVEIANPKKAIALVNNIDTEELKGDVTKREILAAAYAALGNFDKAIDYQEKALDKAEYLDFDTTELKQHLSLFKQNKKWF
jgi:uncharacterized protein